ncbi:molybdopterin-dependent oxidoreductase [Spirillospora sp. CA-253888]
MKTDRRSPHPLSAALTGLLGVAVALGVAEFAAAFVRAQAAPVIAVGGDAIDRTPEWLKSFAIRTFGEHDKQVLLGGLVLGLAVLATLIGLVAGRRRGLGVLGMAVLGAVGLVAALGRPGGDLTDALPALLGAAAGAIALVLLLRAASMPTRAGIAEGADADDEHRAGGRRSFLLAAGGAAAVAAAGGSLGRVSAGRRGVAEARRAVRLPAPARRAAPVPTGADLRIPGLSPFVTPNADFYRVDTALTLPQVDPADWRLRVHGMVERPVELTFAELLRRPLVERDITLACVSNQVGGPYVGHARWLGIVLADLLREAGPQAGADQLLSRSADGWTCGTPLGAVLDGRDAMLAVGMNGEPLPIAHGFPVRMVVPGLYGYVSATKWLVDLEVTRYRDHRAYWTARGWATDAPVKTMARIEVPRPLRRVEAGRVAVAGTAWAQHRGVAAVQVRVDGGPWRQARLAPVPGADTWRQWVLEWDAAPGVHRLEVRATDAGGAVQPPERVPPYPDGATGWHSIVVTVE